MHSQPVAPGKPSAVWHIFPSRLRADLVVELQKLNVCKQVCLRNYCDSKKGMEHEQGLSYIFAMNAG